ncbi:MAG TPA: hypothetical protein VFV83_05165, partial [Chthoniobacteraceae bacterium]|nr:hypothetical protein [Chthoniobacteraceae bacterium]
YINKKLKRAVIVSGVSGGHAGAETQSNDPVELSATSIPSLYVIGSRIFAVKRGPLERRGAESAQTIIDVPATSTRSFNFVPPRLTYHGGTPFRMTAQLAIPFPERLPRESWGTIPFQMDPYIKSGSPLRGPRKPGVTHGPGRRRIDPREKAEVAATRRALKKAARREGKREIDEVTS